MWVCLKRLCVTHDHSSFPTSVLGLLEKKKEEYETIRAGHKTFTNSAPYWLGGSTNIEINDQINYTQYNSTGSGKIHFICSKGNLSTFFKN